jgi:hypothetical protein
VGAAAAAATLIFRDMAVPPLLTFVLKSGDLDDLRSCLSSCFSPPQMITALEPSDYSKALHTFVSET